MKNQRSKEKIRKDIAGASIGIAILTIIGAFLLPMLQETPISDPEVFPFVAVALVMGLALLTAGVMFLRKDSNGLAKFLLVFYFIYVIERGIMLLMNFSPIHVFWLVFGIIMITHLFKYRNAETFDQFSGHFGVTKENADSPQEPVV